MEKGKETKMKQAGAIWVNKSKFGKGDYLSWKNGNKVVILQDYGPVTKNNRPRFRDADGLVAGWLMKSRKGEEYISLRLKNGERYVAFKNTFKKGEKEPAWKVYESEPRATA